MTERGDYFSEMAGITDLQAETLLARAQTLDPDLGAVAAVLSQLDLDRLEVSLSERAGKFSLRAAAIARQQIDSERVTSRRRWTPRLVTSASTAFLLLALSGVAVAADGSTPGDALYGIDRAVERLGLNAGGIAERLEEAGTLADRGLPTAALNHVAESLADEQGVEASERAIAALHEAIGRVGSGNSAEVHAALSEMFQWMATTDAKGRDFGQGIAERARALGKDKDKAAKDPKPDRENGNNGNGNGPPGGVPPGQVGR